MPKSLWRVLMLIAAAAAGVGVFLRRRGRRDDEDGFPLPREASAGRPGEGLAYLGNRDSAVFHVEGCRMFTADQDAPSFATREEALEAGYRPCGICHP